MPQEVQLKSTTGQLRLVPPAASDNEVVAQLRSHPETRRFLRFLPVNVSTGDIQQRRETRAKDEHIMDFDMHLTDDDGTKRFVGMCGLFDLDKMNESCSIGILVSPQLIAAVLLRTHFTSC